MTKPAFIFIDEPQSLFDIKQKHYRCKKCGFETQGDDLTITVIPRPMLRVCPSCLYDILADYGAVLEEIA